MKRKYATFTELNTNVFFSKGMGGVNIVDQVRGSYKLNIWSRKYKWWYVIFGECFKFLWLRCTCYKKPFMKKYI